MHFIFDSNEWCNLSNENNPVSYRDAFSQPDVPLWQAAYEDEMKSLCDHKVWDLIPCDQVPTGNVTLMGRLSDIKYVSLPRALCKNMG